MIGTTIRPYADKIEVTRYKAGHYNSDGRWVEGAAEKLCLEGSVQPAKEEDVQRLPEGFRNKKAIRIYSEKEFKATNPETQTKGDVLAWEGDLYEVQMITKHTKIMPHWKVIAVRIELEGAEKGVLE